MDENCRLWLGFAAFLFTFGLLLVGGVTGLEAWPESGGIVTALLGVACALIGAAGIDIERKHLVAAGEW